MASFPTLVCQQFTTSSEGVVSCTQQVWLEAYVFSPQEQAQVELVLQGGLSWEVFGQFFLGTLLMFAIGFGIGLILSQVRKV